MNLNGMNGLTSLVRPPKNTTRNRIEHDRPTQLPSAPAPAPSSRPLHQPAPVAARDASLPVEAPAGTDPELWSVLTSEERSFFAKVGAMGPLTYGHLLNSASTDTPIMRGGRLDVKV